MIHYQCRENPGTLDALDNPITWPGCVEAPVWWAELEPPPDIQEAERREAEEKSAYDFSSLFAPEITETDRKEFDDFDFTKLLGQKRKERGKDEVSV